jgi:hypothetical protein
VANMRLLAERKGHADLPARLRMGFSMATGEPLRWRHATVWEAGSKRMDELRSALVACHPLGRVGGTRLFQSFEPVPDLVKRVLAADPSCEMTVEDRDNIRRRHFDDLIALHGDDWIDHAAIANFLGVVRHTVWRLFAEHQGRPASNGLTEEARTMAVALYDEDRFPTWTEYHRFLVDEHGFAFSFKTLQGILLQRGFRVPRRGPGHVTTRAEQAARAKAAAEAKVVKRDKIVAEYRAGAYASWTAFRRHLASQSIGVGAPRLARILEEAGFVRPPVVRAEPKEKIRKVRPPKAPKVRPAAAKPPRKNGAARPGPKNMDATAREVVLSAFDVETPRTYAAFYERLLRENDGFKYHLATVTRFLKANGRTPVNPGPVSFAEQDLVRRLYDPSRFKTWTEFHRLLVADHGFAPCVRRLAEYVQDLGLPPPARETTVWRDRIIAAFDELKPESYKDLHRHLQAEGFTGSRSTLQNVLERSGRSVDWKAKFTGAWKDELLARARSQAPIKDIAAFHRKANAPVKYATLRTWLIKEKIEFGGRVCK